MSIEVNPLLNTFGLRKRWLGHFIYWVHNGDVKRGIIESIGVSRKTVFFHVFGTGVGMVYPPPLDELYESEYEANQACMQSHLDVVTRFRKRNTELLKKQEEGGDVN